MELQLQQLIVTKANELAQASSNLTLVESKAIEYCISTIFKDQVVTATDIFEVDVEHLSNIFGLGRSQAYREVRKLMEGLLTKVIRIDFLGQRESFQWLSCVRSNDTKSGVYIQFNHIVCLYLSPERLKKGSFTSYPLEHVRHFKHRFSLPLYNICKSNHYAGAGFRTELSLDSLRELLFIDSKDYTLWANLKVQLSKAIAEIEAKAGFKIKIVERKTGKKVTSIVFLTKEQ